MQFFLHRETLSKDVLSSFVSESFFPIEHRQACRGTTMTHLAVGYASSKCTWKGQIKYIKSLESGREFHSSASVLTKGPPSTLYSVGCFPKRAPSVACNISGVEIFYFVYPQLAFLQIIILVHVTFEIQLLIIPRDLRAFWNPIHFNYLNYFD